MVVLEAEAKIRIDCDARSELHSRLAELGFFREWSGYEEDIYYQHPCRDVAETDEAIRVRVSERGRRLTYKGPRMGGRLKTRVEYEAGVDGHIEHILESLGFRPSIRVRKHRIIYRGHGASVTLDTVEGLGCFVEVEVLDGGEEEVIGIIKMLGLNSGELVTESYAMLLMKKRGEG